MTFSVGGPPFDDGDRVQLGNGTKGRVQREVTGPTGFKSYEIKLDNGEQTYATKPTLTKVAVTVGNLRLACAVMRTPAELSKGLQGHPRLGDDEGMLFAFDPPRAASFHMGSVDYPIDIVFIEPSGRVGKIVHSAQPGTHKSWGHNLVAYVLETPGGLCKHAGISIGAQTTLPPEAYYRIRMPVEDSDPGESDPDRYKDRGMPDDVSPDAMDGAAPNWDQQFGYDPTNRDYSDGDGPGMRPTAQYDHVIEPTDYITTLLNAMSTRTDILNWKQDALNPRVAYAIITPAEIMSSLQSTSTMSPEDAVHIREAVASESGMQTLGDGLVLTGVAHSANVAPGPKLILWGQPNNG